VAEHIGDFHKISGTLRFAGIVVASADGVTIVSDDASTYTPEEARKLAHLLMRGAERAMDLQRQAGIRG